MELLRKSFYEVLKIFQSGFLGIAEKLYEPSNMELFGSFNCYETLGSCEGLQMCP